MTAIMSMTGIFGGTYIACIAERYPTNSRHLDTLAGLLLVAGLAIIGASRAIVG